LRQAERTFDFWRRQLEMSFLNKVVRLALMDGAAKGLLPNAPEVAQGQWQWPGSVSIDAGRDARADIELWRMGLATAADLYGEVGLDWQASIRQRAKEAAYIREMATEMDVSPAEISGGVESVATDPNRAPIETPVDGEQSIALPESDTAQTVQDTALNGAQVQALLELAKSVASGIITAEAGKAIATAAFPLLPSETIDRIFDNIEVGEITPQEIRDATREADFSTKPKRKPAPRRKKT